MNRYRLTKRRRACSTVNPMKAFSFPLSVNPLQASTFVVEHSSGFFCCLLDRNLNILWLGLLSVWQEITELFLLWWTLSMNCQSQSGRVRQSLSGLLGKDSLGQQPTYTRPSSEGDHWRLQPSNSTLFLSTLAASLPRSSNRLPRLPPPALPPPQLHSQGHCCSQLKYYSNSTK